MKQPKINDAYLKDKIQAINAYDRAMAQAWEACWKIISSAIEDYYTAITQARRDYEKTIETVEQTQHDRGKRKRVRSATKPESQ
jgi:hypothetical protein